MHKYYIKFSSSVLGNTRCLGSTPDDHTTSRYFDELVPTHLG
jgi:hypothetical protein